MSEALKVFQPGVCNRLDLNTSGIVLSGKHLTAVRELSLILKKCTIKKYYLCLVQGNIKEGRKMSDYLRKNPKMNKVSISHFRKEDSFCIDTSYEPFAWYE